MKDLKLPIFIAVMFIAILLSAMVGYYFGKSKAAACPVAAQMPANSSIMPAITAQPPVVNQSPAPQKPKAAPVNQISPETLSKQKNIPVSITNNTGKYTLVSVVEGAEMNQKLSNNLQLVTLQRQKLGNLSQQFDKAPANAVQQRELIASEINKVRNALNQNLQFMARGYGYTLSNVYLRVPYDVSLMFEDKVGDKVQLKLLHEFKNAKQYDSFQNENNTYIKLKQQVSTLTKASEKKVGSPEELKDPEELETPVVVELDSKTKAEINKLNEKLDVLRQSLLKKYKYDPEKRHRLIFNKSALYAKPA